MLVCMYMYVSILVVLFVCVCIRIPGVCGPRCEQSFPHLSPTMRSCLAIFWFIHLVARTGHSVQQIPLDGTVEAATNAHRTDRIEESRQQRRGCRHIIWRHIKVLGPGSIRTRLIFSLCVTPYVCACAWMGACSYVCVWAISRAFVSPVLVFILANALAPTKDLGKQRQRQRQQRHLQKDKRNSQKDFSCARFAAVAAILINCWQLNSIEALIRCLMASRQQKLRTI